jgi:hypothetical protein
LDGDYLWQAAFFFSQSWQFLFEQPRRYVIGILTGWM